MSSRRPSPEHQEAVSRRLALLSAELASARDGAGDPGDVGDSGGPGASSWTDGHTRIRPARDPVRPAPEPAPLVPTPGRHAARRAGRVLTAAVPATVRGRVTVGPAQLTVVAVLVAAALAITCWWVVRDDAEPLQAPGVEAPSAPLVSEGPLGDASPVASEPPGPRATADSTGTVTVDVAGKVRRPGIAVLDLGARVVDALEAAGGARRSADLTGLNLARMLVDGEQIVVGQPAPTGVPASAVPSPGATQLPLVNLNTASQTELETLPEVGPVTATSILSWRDEHGGFTAVEELLEVDGIGDATLAQLAPHVTL